MNIPDQKGHWNNLHKNNALKAHAKKPSDFAQEVISLFPPKANVLELGCGLGNDALYFAKRGHTVLATDFSDEAIRQNKNTYKNIENLSFRVLNMSQPLPFKDSNFDVVYSRLSLHYFTDDKTRKIIKEIHRVLKPNGLLCFICKSVKDPLYGVGELIEKDVFIRNEHIRHFFSKEYAKSLLKEGYSIQKLESGEDNFYGKQSAYVKVVAKKL